MAVMTAGKSSGNPPFGYFALYAMWKYVQAGLGDAAPSLKRLQKQFTAFFP